MCWRGRVVLVTGAGGFIGSHLAEALVERGAAVRALVHYNAMNSHGWLDRSPVHDTIQFVAGDLCDRDRVAKAVEGASVVFHLAALIGIPYSYQAPHSYVRANVEGSLNIFQASLQAGVSRVVHTSTSEVYGTAHYTPMDEQHPLQAQSPYAATKIAADKMAEAFHRCFGLPVVTLRPFNTFGPRQSERALIPTVIAQALRGGTVRLGNLDATRDFTFVGDTVAAFLAAAEAENAVGETINTGSGREISVRELVQLIAPGARVEQQAERLRPAESEIGRLVADTAKARRLLGWSPRVSLEEGFRITREWIAANESLYRGGAFVR